MEYVVFTDESHITASRFQSLSAFSIHKSSWAAVSEDIKIILNDSSVTEFKWQKLKDARYYFCAEKLVNYLMKNLQNHKTRT